MHGKGNTLSWLGFAIAYAFAIGLTGITIKYALKTISWQQMVLWVPLCYAAFSLVLVLGFGVRFPLGIGGFWAALTGIFAAAALILLFIALDRGPASSVVPVTSIYPVITLFASAIILSESITVPKAIGTALVVAGVALISR